MSNQPYYETMYILRPTIPEDEVDSHLTKYTDILEKAGGEVLDNQMRGKRRLAYPIGKHKEGIYVQLSHKGDGQHIAVLEKAMRLTEDVIRYLTVKQDGPLPTKRSSPKPNEKDNKEESESKKEDVVKGKKEEVTKEKKEEVTKEKKEEVTKEKKEEVTKEKKEEVTKEKKEEVTKEKKEEVTKEKKEE